MADFKKDESRPSNEVESRNSENDEEVPREDLDSTTEPSERTITVNDPEQAPQPQVKEADIPPDGGYGWVVVICSFLINAHTWGINSVNIEFFLIFLGIC